MARVISGGNSPKQVNPAASSPAKTACAGCGTRQARQALLSLCRFHPRPGGGAHLGAVFLLLLQPTNHHANPLAVAGPISVNLTPESLMIIQEQTAVDLATPTGPMRTYMFRPVAKGKYPAVVLFSEIFQATGPIRRFAAFIAGHGYIVAVPEVYHELEPAGTVLPYDQAGSDKGNADKYGRPFRPTTATRAHCWTIFTTSKIALAGWEPLAFAWVGIWHFARP